MSLANEAAYLYVFSKKLLWLNRKLRGHSEDAEHHRRKYYEARHPDEQQKHLRKHTKASEKIKKLLKEHNEVLAKLKHHQIAFAHSLQKEHKF